MLGAMLDPVPALVLVLGAMTLGCASEVRSCDLATDAIVMWATVNDVDGRIEVEVEFENAAIEGSSLELCPDRDRVEVNGTEASAIQALGHVYYVLELDGSASAREVEIVLQRADPPSVSAIVELPPTIETIEMISQDPQNDGHSRAAPLEIAWTPAWPGGTLGLAVEDAVGSDCLESLGVSYDVEDIGSYTISAHTLVSSTGGTCELTLALTRSVLAEYPAELHEGGRVAGFVRRRQPFTSTE